MEAALLEREDAEESGERLGALEPDLDELREPHTERASPGYDDNQTRVAVLAKLVVLEGPDAGREVPFIGIRMVLGRAPNLEITLKDPAVSRRHIEFIQGDKGMLLRDLGSGNGTLINEERVTEKILAHHDVITVGTTRLRYIDNGAKAVVAASEDTSAKSVSQLALRKKEEPAKEAEPEPEAEKELVRQELPPIERVRRKRKKGEKQEGVNKKKRLILILGGAGVLLCGLLAVFLASGKKEPPPELGNAVVVTTESLISQARKAVRDGEDEEALRLLEQIAAISPQTDTSHFRKQVELEKEVKTSLQEVETLVARKEFELAKGNLDKIPEASARLNERKKELLERMLKEEQQFHLQRAEELLMLGDFDAALKTLSVLPRAMQAAVGQKVEEGRASYEEAKRQVGRRIDDDRRNDKIRRTEEQKQKVALAFADVQRKFNGEEWKRAADECDRVFASHPKEAEIKNLAKKLQKQILEFGFAYDEGVRKYRAGQLAAAAKPLSKAYALYSKMSLHSAAGESLKEMLSQAALLAGEDAFSRGDFAAAATHCKEAKQIQSSSERAQRCIQRVAEKAEDLFGMGYTLKSSNAREALRYFKLVMEITPRGSIWYEKAKNQIDSMSVKSLEQRFDERWN